MIPYLKPQTSHLTPQNSGPHGLRTIINHLPTPPLVPSGFFLLPQLVQLPRQPSVTDILLRYEEADVDSGGLDSTAEMASGLKTYFERALPAILLYKQERGQYANALEEGGQQSPSEVYGAEHLLRLFSKRTREWVGSAILGMGLICWLAAVKLPDLLSSVPMEKETLTLLKHKLHHFLK